MKQAITLVLVFALLLSAWSLLPGVAVAQEPDGGTESVMIRTADDLAGNLRKARNLCSGKRY